MKRCGIVLNRNKKCVQVYSKLLIRKLEEEGIEVWWEDDQETQTDGTDVIIILGGDGTTLRAFRKYLDLNVPYICINFGKVGFLSSVEPEEFIDYLPRLVREDYYFEKRSILQVANFKSNRLMKDYYALNEVVIRSNKPKPCHQSLYVDGHFCLEVEGDGILCSTPTGSTAYSLSAGGPVVDLELESIIITPICAVNPSISSYVVSSQRVLHIMSNDLTMRRLIIDGEEIAVLSNLDMVSIKLAKNKAEFIQFHENRYLSLLPLLSRKQNRIHTSDDMQKLTHISEPLRPTN